MSEPSGKGYVRAVRVTAGPGGGKIDIPAPIGMTIDASKLPELLPWKAKAEQGLAGTVRWLGGYSRGGRCEAGSWPGGRGADQEERRVVVERGADVLVQVGAD
jgi:hypothetical protein